MAQFTVGYTHSRQVRIHHRPCTVCVIHSLSGFSDITRPIWLEFGAYRLFDVLSFMCVHMCVKPWRLICSACHFSSPHLSPSLCSCCSCDWLKLEIYTMQLLSGGQCMANYLNYWQAHKKKTLKSRLVMNLYSLCLFVGKIYSQNDPAGMEGKKWL